MYFNHGLFVPAHLVPAALTSSFQSRSLQDQPSDSVRAREVLNEHLFTKSVVDNIEEDTFIEGVQEELELEAGHPIKQVLLVTSPTKRSKPNVSTILK